MAMITVKIKLDLKPLTRLSNTIRQDMLGNTRGPVRAAIRQWGARWRSFSMERFDKFSKGGGDWRELKPATEQRRRKARRKHKGARKFSILRDTNTMFQAVRPTVLNPGSIEKDIRYGLRVGYGGPARYKKGKSKGKATIADIAHFHQTGAGKLPVRKIVVKPDPATIQRMNGDLKRGVNKAIRGQG